MPYKKGTQVANVDWTPESKQGKYYLSQGYTYVPSAQTSQKLAPVPSGNVPTTPSPTAQVSAPVPKSQQTMRDLVAQKMQSGIIKSETPADTTGDTIDTTATGETPIGEKITSEKPPEFEEPTAGDTSNAYFNSLSQQVTNLQSQLKEERERQTKTIQEEVDRQQKIYDEQKASQKGAIEQYGTAAEDEKKLKMGYLEEEKKRFDENYTTVQGLASQLQEFMTTGNATIQAEKERTGLASIRNPRVLKVTEDIAAQTGVINAAISVYNGQMSQAQSQLVNSSNVITSAFKDELDYYTKLQDFYNTKAADTNEKIITLSRKEQELLDDKITSIQDNLTRAEDNAQQIIDLMIDPTTALKMANAGVTLYDTPQQVMKKLANEEYKEEVRTQVSDKSKEGYQLLLTPEAIASKDPAYLVRLTDSHGVERVYYNGEAEKKRIADVAKGVGVGGGGVEKGTEAERARSELGLTLSDEVEIYANALLSGIEVDPPPNIEAAVIKRVTEKQEQVQAGEITQEEIAEQQQGFLQQISTIDTSPETLKYLPEAIGETTGKIIKKAPPEFMKLYTGTAKKIIGGSVEYAKGLISGLLK